MPIPFATVAPLISAGLNTGGNIASTILNNRYQQKANQQSQEWQEKMYYQQRRDALSDWQLQVDYNSPSAMMSRYKDAGLNPNLIYGQQGIQAPAVRTSSPGSFHAEPKKVDLSNLGANSIGTYFDVSARQAQIDNLQKTNAILDEERKLKAAQILATLTGIDWTKALTQGKQFDTKLKSDLRETTIEQAMANLNLTNYRANEVMAHQRREDLKADQGLRESAERILNMRISRAKTAAEISNLRALLQKIKADTRLKQLDINLKKNGIQPGDEIYWRVLSQLLSGDIDLSNAGNSLN